MQISLFDGTQKFIIDKPIRLIELFGGYGSQHFALDYLGVKVEQWKLCEWAVKSIQAYKDAHCKDDNTDYSINMSHYQIVQFLLDKGISANYNTPMKERQIIHLGVKKARQIYNNIMATHNLVNIQQVHGKDLEIVDTDKFCYVMTYSFPCQDLSSAGLGKGMAKGSGTRSGMLWEVERILDELDVDGKNKLPQVLLMENVPEVIGTNNVKHFAKWLEKLESMGYHCYYKVLNAKDYGVPQNRERCFMVSILGDYFYDFPKPIKLEHRLKDLLEDEVDEKFYLSDKAINGALNTTFNCSRLENKTEKDGIIPTLCARDYKDPKLVIEEPVPCEIRVDEGIRTFQDNIMGTLRTIDGCGGKHIIEPKILEENLKTKLCNDLIASGKVKENDVIRHSYSTNRMEKMYIQNQVNHDCSPTLDTRCDCLGVVVNDEPKVLGGFGKIGSTGQYHQQNRIYDDKVAISVTTGFNPFYKANLRIRKLTPKECFRLMGVKDEDFENIAKNQSNASLYHLAGDSIVVDVLMAIFKKML